MTICFRCKIELTANNSSEEHILLNSIGGFLKSKNLLCKNCNIYYGDLFDNAFGEQCNIFSNFLDIKRDRGRVQNINGIYIDNGDSIYIEPGGKIFESQPKIDIKETDLGEKINLELSFDMSKRKLPKFLKSLSKKYPNVDIEYLMSNVQHSKRTKPIATVVKLAGLKTLQSITKTAISFYLFNGGKIDNIKHLLPFLDDETRNSNVSYYYPADIIYDPHPNEASHIIKLIGNQTERIILCYIEIFNVFNFIILLNENYVGESFDHTYGYDVLTETLINPNIRIDLTKNDIKDIIKHNEIDYIPLQMRIDHTIRLGMVKQKKILIENIIKETILEFKSNNLDIDDYEIEFMSTVDQKIDKLPQEFLKIGNPFTGNVPNNTNERNKWIYDNYNKYS